MTKPEVLGLAAALACAVGGATLFSLVGFPAAALTGSALAVTLYTVAGGRVIVPARFRDLCFLVLGINIGAGITPEMLRAAISIPLSIGILAITLTAGLFLCRFMLVHGFGFDRRSAVLASAPGHMSFVIALATETNSSVHAVVIIQAIRVLFLTLCVPPAITWIFGASGLDFLPVGTFGVLSAVVLLVSGVAVAFAFQRLRFPAAWILAGMCVSGIGHATSLTEGGWPPIVITGALIGLGMLIGSRFSGMGLNSLRRVLWASVAVTAVTLGVATLGAVLVILVMDQSAALMIVAFAPGGVEAMTAMALALGLDPAIVAAHHVSRLLLLPFILPLALAGRREED